MPYGAQSWLDRVSGKIPQAITAGRVSRGSLERVAAPTNVTSASTASVGSAAMAAAKGSYWPRAGSITSARTPSRIAATPVAVLACGGGYSAPLPSGRNSAPTARTASAYAGPVRNRTRCPREIKCRATPSIGETWPS